MESRLKELVELIGDLAERDEEHLLLEAHEIAAIRILKTTGNMGFSMLSPESKNDTGDILIEYSSIQPYVLQLYVDIVLVVKHVGVADFTKMDFSHKIPQLTDSFGLKLVVLMQNTVGAMLEGLEKENSVLFGASLKLLHAFVMSILDMYNVSIEDFYDAVEDYVYVMLTTDAKSSSNVSVNKLKVDFKGSRSVTLSIKIDRRKKNPFIGFRVTIGNNKTILFSNASPYKAFLEATKYINELTQFRDIKFHLDSKTKVFLNGYSIMYAKEDVLVEDKTDGFYPVLVPIGVTDMEGFLEALTK